MGLKFKDIVEGQEIEMRDLSGKVIAIDSMNILYQFLSSIRAADGTLLTTSKGKVTSHLIGLFNRTMTFLEEGIKPVFVFDGKAPEIKRKTQELRSEAKKQASLRLQAAQEEGDEEQMRKYAARTSRLSSEMIEDAKKLILALGLPLVQAPSEGEAQTAAMVSQGNAYASISQDYDNLIFGCPLLIRNLSIAGKRKRKGKYAYETIKAQAIRLEEVLSTLELSLEQLQVLAILVGTDYNPGGIKGIGPKKGLKLLREHGSDFTAIFAAVSWDKHYPSLSWQEILQTIQEIPVSSKYSLEWKTIDEKALRDLLVDSYEFSEERVVARLEKLEKSKASRAQKGLGSFF